MDWENGLWGQINKLEPVQFKPLTTEDLTEELMKTQAKPINYNTIYVCPDTCDIFWEFTYHKKFIDVYGIKQIGMQNGFFVYEGILFDEFPKKYSMLSCTYLNNNGFSICEEVELIELTDTKIVFKLSFLIPKEETNITLEWD